MREHDRGQHTVRKGDKILSAALSLSIFADSEQPQHLADRNVLTPYESAVFCLRQGMTVEGGSSTKGEIGIILNFSRRAVNNFEKRAKRKLAQQANQ